jgi:acetyltransferase-like isoleucine patch superfamily enzyme
VRDCTGTGRAEVSIAHTHELAVVETDRIGEGVVIGPYCVVGADVTIEDGVRLHPHVVAAGNVTIGAATEVFPGAVLGKAPARSAALSRIPERGGDVRVGSGCSIGAQALIYEGVTIGSECLVGDFASVREGCRVGTRCIVGRYVSVHPDCDLGDRCRLYDHTHVASGTRMGIDCFVSVHVAMASDNALGTLPYSPERVRGPLLGDRVSIGVGARILPDIHLGDDAVVAAGSVVTRDVEAHTVVRGVPARPAGSKSG